MSTSGAGDPAEGGQVAQEGTSQEGTSTEFDYEAGYSKLRPEYTRATQELSAANERLSEFESLFEALQDPESQAEALAALGFDLEAGTPTGDQQAAIDEWTDPLETEIASLRETVAELTAQREQEASQREAQELVDLRDEYIGEAISYIEDALSEDGKPFKFDAKEEEVLGNLAIAMEREDGVPDVQGAYNSLYGSESVQEIMRQRWIDTKTGASRAPGGRSTEQRTRPTTSRERVAYVDERMAELEG